MGLSVTGPAKWLLSSAVVALLVLTVIGMIAVWTRNNHAPGVEILLAFDTPVQGTIYIGDGVAMPGTFPFTPRDTIGDLLDAAGGLKDEAFLDRLTLRVVADSAEQQRVDINRAEPWLLKALPGIGDVLAQRIVDYRRQNGPFQSAADLTRVSGVGKDTYEKIAGLITVGRD
jgi:competence protein ComEA